MSKKFHIDINGHPQPCTADVRTCPRGGEDYHASSKEEAKQLADRINEEISEARDTIDNRVNKLMTLFDKKHQLTLGIEKRKKLIDKHENEIWKKRYREFMLEEPFCGHTEASFKKEYFANDPEYTSIKKEYENLIHQRGIYIQQRKKAVEIAKKMKPYIRSVSFSNASGSCYFVFGKKDSEKVLTLLKENDIIVDRAEIDLEEKSSVFSVRIADHKKHKTKYNATTTSVSARFGELETIKPKEHKKEIEKLEGDQRFIAGLMREINGRRK